MKISSLTSKEGDMSLECSKTILVRFLLSFPVVFSVPHVIRTCEAERKEKGPFKLLGSECCTN